jgi:hypothetical protein
VSGTKDGHQEGGLVPSHACNIAETLSAIEEGAQSACAFLCPSLADRTLNAYLDYRIQFSPPHDHALPPAVSEPANLPAPNLYQV